MFTKLHIWSLLLRIAGDVGFNNMDLLPLLLTLLRDATPAIARQAITCGITLFRCSLIKTAIQVIFFLHEVPCLTIQGFQHTNSRQVS
ncbi:hypothetical protein HanPI659440_Chr15g0579911 [Helianthus annuus]|nr:hypothetical protein HanPI659440_Chr15g0579911 [Helianthus annuus]